MYSREEPKQGELTVTMLRDSWAQDHEDRKFYFNIKICGGSSG